jgi:hypothetical protein
MVVASCGGAFMLKNEDEAWSMLENLSNNSIQQVSTRRRALMQYFCDQNINYKNYHSQ